MKKIGSHLLSERKRSSMNSLLKITTILCLWAKVGCAFTVPSASSPLTRGGIEKPFMNTNNYYSGKSETSLNAAADLEIVSLVAGQENYGLAIVAVGEALWSFSAAPSLDHAKVLVPATVSAVILAALSGPMITSGNADSVATGLEIATFVSIGLGLSYLARLLASYSPSPKEIAFGGLLVAIAGFFSFSQNLVVDGFVTLPSIPLPSLPSLPSISLPF